jgi:hypothetical protein
MLTFALNIQLRADRCHNNSLHRFTEKWLSDHFNLELPLNLSDRKTTVGHNLIIIYHPFENA